MRAKALDGVRIVSAEDFLALPFGSMLLADLGAEVIRVLSPTVVRGGFGGIFPDGKPGPRYWDHNGNYDVWYRNKKSLTLDLTKPQGVELFKELVKRSDIVMENNRPGVMKRFGLDYEELKKVKSDIILITSTGYGHEGLWGAYGAFARTIDAMSGMSDACGYLGGPPVRANPSYMDITTGWNNAIAAMTALHYRRRTGKGQWIDHSMYESGVSCVGQALLDYQVNHRQGTRMGNRHASWAPHGCYPCRGNDEWVVIAVTSDEEWQALCQAMGKAELAADERFADALSRWKNQEELDKLIGQWTSTQNRHELARQLQGVGVPAGAVNRSKDLYLDPHLKERGFFQRFSRPDAKEMGDVRSRPYIGWPFKMSRTQPVIESIANMGEHNEYVLGELLGKSEAEIAKLYQEGVIARMPVGAEENRPKPERPDAVFQRSYAGRGDVIEYDPNFKEVLGLKD